jgi:UrcA family protein
MLTKETDMFAPNARFSIFAAAALMLAASAGIADAQTRSVDVHVSDLDLASDAGRTLLQQRIGHAVDNICGSPHARSTWEEQNYATCSKATRAQVQTKVDTMIAAAENARKVAGERNTTPAM